MRPELHIRSGQALLEGVASHMAESLGRDGGPSLVLSGGATPQRVYELLARVPYRDRIPWSSLRVFWGDERCVGPGDARSNFRMAEDALLARVPAAEVFRIEGELEPEEAAGRYERVIRQSFSLGEGEWPRFSLVLLGLGEDGHTASLFPGTAALWERRSIATAVRLPAPGVHRVTLTIPALTHAAEVLVLVTGRAKAPIVRDVLGEGGSRYPIGLIRPVEGRMTWYLDDEAASLLKGAP